jgi:hypothetical protein
MMEKGGRVESDTGRIYRIGDKNMKTTKCIMMWVCGFMFCFLCAGFVGTTAAQDREPDYYFVHGQKLPWNLL